MRTLIFIILSVSNFLYADYYTKKKSVDTVGQGSEDIEYFINNSLILSVSYRIFDKGKQTQTMNVIVLPDGGRYTFVYKNKKKHYSWLKSPKGIFITELDTTNDGILDYILVHEPKGKFIFGFHLKNQRLTPIKDNIHKKIVKAKNGIAEDILLEYIKKNVTKQ